MESHNELKSAPTDCKRNIFRSRHRISSSDDFQRAFDGRTRKSRGPYTVFVVPIDANEHRLGLSIGKRVGNAVTRSRVKRSIRNAFRLIRHELPNPSEGGSYDIVVTSRKQDPIEFELTKRFLFEAIRASHGVCEKRSQGKTLDQNRDPL